MEHEDGSTHGNTIWMISMEHEVRSTGIVSPTECRELRAFSLMEYEQERTIVLRQTEYREQSTVVLGHIEYEEQSTMDLGQRGYEEREECEVRCTLNKKKWWILGLIVAGIIVIIVGAPLGVLRTKRQEFSAQFINKCQKFMGGNHERYCQEIFAVFKQAYVGRPECNVPVEAYDPLMAKVPFRHSCNKTMLWSKTKDLVHMYTQRTKDCFTLEDTLLGYILDGQKWCGKEGGDETFTTGCPGCDGCENNPVRSFWNRASAGFAEHACGNVTVMLNGSKEQPFDPNSTLARIEIKALKQQQVKHLNVILVTGHKKMSNCATQSLQDLRGKLDPNIGYTCREVMKSQIEECATNTNAGCGACLSKVLK